MAAAAEAPHGASENGPLGVVGEALRAFREAQLARVALSAMPLPDRRQAYMYAADELRQGSGIDPNALPDEERSERSLAREALQALMDALRYSL